MGAGVQPLEGATRRKGQTYNLNDIQNLATPSAYIYRSMFIRLPDVDKKTLTICQPNRRKCGPMREISDSLQSMIKDLVFNNELSQENCWDFDLKAERSIESMLLHPGNYKQTQGKYTPIGY
ncbi:hypothetical protein F443_14786 [Phytophthora nicotianae P1569]|uniref:Uncharacterized protein n=2 Tax=Phytophthora nicotianae TaxID=4792 RepID=V9EMA3_PHYNI|nr:hypothetical protein F443_14786 [Phytophthora nicotianae P1569]